MIKQILLTFLFLCSSFSETLAQTDSLTFAHEKSGEEVLITQGMIVEILTRDKQREVGEFLSGSSNELQLKQKSGNQSFKISDLKKITVYKEGSKDPITGTLRFVISASSATSLILGAGAAAGGIATIGNNKALGYGLIGLSIPLIYYGGKLFFMLKNADRDVIKMNKGWVAKTN